MAAARSTLAEDVRSRPDPRGPRPETAPDPRTHVTPYAFGVDPALLGLPLASPWRRLAALLLDLLLVAILSGLGFTTLALAAGLVFLWLGRGRRRGVAVGATSPGDPSEPPHPRGRRPFRVLGFIFLTWAMLLLLFRIGDRIFEGPSRTELAERAASMAEEGRFGEAGRSVGSAALVVAELARIQAAGSPEAAAEAAERLAERLHGLGVDSAEVGATLREGAAEAADERPEIAQAVLAVAARYPIPPPDTLSPALAEAFAGATAAGDTLGADSLRARLAAALLADTLANMQQRREQLLEQIEDLEEAIEEGGGTGAGVIRWLRRTLDELGIGIGWAALYFTVLMVVGHGATPGKRLLRTRVLRLNGQPMTWFIAFERFGGYAAGLATGLLGYAQIFWDPNRQAIHDKITETVVVREGKPRVRVSPT